jgi:hypothetical protein
MIVRMNPPHEADLTVADQAWFDSDAATNSDAIREIDAAAGRHGLVRSREYWLQTFTMPDGRVVRRGFCYRPEPSARTERVAARRSPSPEGISSESLVRQMRDEE